MLSLYHNSISVFALFYYLFSYRRMKGQALGLQLFLYIALFPYRIVIAGTNVLSIALKLLLVLELVILLINTTHIRLPACSVMLLESILFAGFLASVYSNFFDWSMFRSGVINITHILLFLMLLVNRVRSSDGIRALLDCLYRNGLFLSIFAVIEMVIFHTSRAKTTISNPNFLAFYLGVVLCFALYEKRIRLLLLLAFVILLTGSASVVLGMVAVFAVYLSAKVLSKKRLAILVSVVLPLIPLLGIILIGSGAYQKIPIIQYLISMKDPVRVKIWSDGIRDFFSRPYFGYGYYCWRSTWAGRLYPTHNDFLKIMVDLGICGLLSFGAGWVWITNKAVKSKNVMLYLSLFTMVIVFSSFHSNLDSYMCWLCIVFVLFDKYIDSPYLDSPHLCLQNDLLD